MKPIPQLELWSSKATLSEIEIWKRISEEFWAWWEKIEGKRGMFAEFPRWVVLQEVGWFQMISWSQVRIRWRKGKSEKGSWS
jgi:hypothetical protein